MSGTFEPHGPHAKRSSEERPASSRKALLRRNERLLGRSRRARFLARLLGRDERSPVPTIQRLERIEEEPASPFDKQPAGPLDTGSQTVQQPRSGPRPEPRPVPAAEQRHREGAADPHA